MWSLEEGLLQVFLAFNVTVELFRTTEPIIAVDTVILGHRRFVIVRRGAMLEDALERIGEGSGEFQEEETID